MKGRGEKDLNGGLNMLLSFVHLCVLMPSNTRTPLELHVFLL